jgi:hypothetical protein
MADPDSWPFSLTDLAFAKLPPKDLAQFIEREAESVTRRVVASASRAMRRAHDAGPEAYRFVKRMFPLQAWLSVDTVVFPAEAEHATEESALVRQATLADLLALPRTNLQEVLGCLNLGCLNLVSPTSSDFRKRVLCGVSVQQQAAVWKKLYGTDMPPPNPTPRSTRTPNPLLRWKKDAGRESDPESNRRVPDAFLDALARETLFDDAFTAFGELRQPRRRLDCRLCEVHWLRGTQHVLTHHLLHLPLGAPA